MRLVISSTSSSIAAFAVSQAIFKIGFASDVVPVVDLAYIDEAKARIRAVKNPFPFREECSFSTSPQSRESEADTGIPD